MAMRLVRQECSWSGKTGARLERAYVYRFGCHVHVLQQERDAGRLDGRHLARTRCPR